MSYSPWGCNTYKLVTPGTLSPKDDFSPGGHWYSRKPGFGSEPLLRLELEPELLSKVS